MKTKIISLDFYRWKMQNVHEYVKMLQKQLELYEEELDELHQRIGVQETRLGLLEDLAAAQNLDILQQLIKLNNRLDKQKGS